jgi:ubiquinone biosynthesis protein COQ4
MKSPIKNPFKMLRMLKGFWVLSQNPNRLDQVFEIADTGENQAVLQEVATWVAQDPDAERSLREMPRIGSLSLDELEKNPEGSLGREFALHMRKNGLDPAAIPVPEIGANRLRYVKAHLRETHDVWHVVTGMGTDVAGEIGLQAFYLAQLPSRLSAMLIAMGFLHVASVNPGARDAMMSEVVRGWAIGKRAKMFFGVDWKAYWARPLSEVRDMLRVDPLVRNVPLPEQQHYAFEPGVTGVGLRGNGHTAYAA